MFDFISKRKTFALISCILIAVTLIGALLFKIDIDINININIDIDIYNPL